MVKLLYNSHRPSFRLPVSLQSFSVAIEYKQDILRRFPLLTSLNYLFSLFLWGEFSNVLKYIICYDCHQQQKATLIILLNVE